MSKKKYDTNPLDHDVKKVADRTMAAVDEESTTAELPKSDAHQNSESATEAETNALNAPAGPPRVTSSPGFGQQTRAANPMTNADLHTPGTGPAYLPPYSGPVSSSYQPNQRSAGVPPPYQAAPPQPNYSPQYPPPYAPVSPAGYAQSPYRQPFVNRGLGIDPNIEGALGYTPYLGWIMGILILVKEPKTNMFARFHAFQSLLLHGGMFVLGLIFSVLTQAFARIPYASIPFFALLAIIKV